MPTPEEYLAQASEIDHCVEHLEHCLPSLKSHSLWLKEQAGIEPPPDPDPHPHPDPEPDDPSEPHFDHAPDFREIGATVLSADKIHDGEDYDHLILSAGHHVFRGQNRAQTIVVEHGATLELQPGTLTGKDAPLPSAEFDPRQFSNGLVVMGRLIANGDLVSPAWDELQRLIRIESENPNGVRWHVMAMHRAFVDITGVEFSHLGRTLVTPLSATNLIGRYSLHMHGVYGPKTPVAAYQYRVRNCSIHHGRKWLCAIHNTSDGQFTDNLLQHTDGAGLILEDGNEARNTFTGNLIGDIPGNGQNPGARGDSSTLGADFGFEGTGLWARTLIGGNTIDVTVRNCRFGCVVMPQHATNKFTIPLSKFPGANTAIAGEFDTVNPRNGDLYTPAKIQATNCEVGLEAWNTGDGDEAKVIAAGSNLQATKNGILTFFTSHLPINGITIDAPIGFLHQNRTLPSGAYSGRVSATDSLIKGATGIGLRMKNGGTFTRTRFECVDAFHLAWRIDFPHDLIIDECEWTGRLLNPIPIPWASMAIATETNNSLCPVRIFIKNGNEFLRAYVPEQARDYVPPPSSSLGVFRLLGSIEPGLTNAELFDKYQLSTLCYLTPEDAVWREDLGLMVSPVTYQTLPPIAKLLKTNTFPVRVGDVAKFTAVKFDVPCEPLLALLTNGSSYEFRKISGSLSTDHALEFPNTVAKTRADVWFRTADGAVGFEMMGSI